MTELDLAMVANVIAFGALIAAIVAMFASFRSAKAAEQSASLAARTLDRLALREIVRASGDAVIEARRIDDLADELRREYRQLFTYNSSSGGSREKLFADEIEKKVSRKKALAEEAERIASDSSSLSAASERDMTLMISRLDGALSQLRPLRESMERELSSIQKDNQIFREKLVGRAVG